MPAAFVDTKLVRLGQPIGFFFATPTGALAADPHTTLSSSLGLRYLAVPSPFLPADIFGSTITSPA